MIKFNRRERDGVVIVQLSGRLMGGPDAEQFQKLIRELVDAGRLRVVVDLAPVSWINSSGLGTLIAAYTTLRERGGTLKLLAVSRRIEQILQVTKLNTIFESHATEDEVVASFGA
jgi:anti-sigma B factor antagonist